MEPFRWATLLLVPLAIAVIMPSNFSLTRWSSCSWPGLHPVVVVPGYATNELDARLTELYRASSSSSPRCGALKGKGWFRLYLNHTALEDPADVPCFAEQMSAIYDAASDDYYNAVGVETRVPFFGSTRGFRYPDPDRKCVTHRPVLFSSRLIEAMIDEYNNEGPRSLILRELLVLSRLERVGYRDGETLFGASYDFRYAVAPPDHPSRVGSAFFSRLKRLVETASRRNGGKPVTIVAHSYGGTLAYQFLLRRPLPWRRRFVRRFVPVAAPWGGVVLGMLTLVAGNNLGLPFVDPAALRAEYRSLQSSLWPLPSPVAFGAARPLVTTRSRNFSTADMAEFLAAIGLVDAAVGAYESRVLPLFRELPSPRVPVACVLGVGVDTREMLEFPGDEFDVLPRMVMGDGDGLVNLPSLVAVDPAWRRPGEYFRMDKVRNVSHLGMLLDEHALAVIIRSILRPN